MTELCNQAGDVRLERIGERSRHVNELRSLGQQLSESRANERASGVELGALRQAVEALAFERGLGHQGAMGALTVLRLHLIELDTTINQLRKPPTEVPL